MSFISKAVHACGAIALVAALSSAQAAVVDFTQAAEGGVYTNPTGSYNGPSLYVAQGFEFLAVGPDGHFHENVGDSSSVFLHSNYGNVTTNRWVLSMTGGGAFDVSNFTLTQGALNWLTDTGVVGTVGTALERPEPDQHPFADLPADLQQRLRRRDALHRERALRARADRRGAGGGRTTHSHATLSRRFSKRTRSRCPSRRAGGWGGGGGGVGVGFCCAPAKPVRLRDLDEKPGPAGASCFWVGQPPAPRGSAPRRNAPMLGASPRGPHRPMSAPSGLSLRARLYLVLVLALALVASSALLGWWQSKRLAAIAQSLYDDRLVPVDLLRELEHTLGAQQLGALLISQAQQPDAEKLDTAGQRLTDQTRQLWSRYLATRMVPAETALIARTQPLLDQLWAALTARAPPSPDTLRELNQRRLATMRLLDELIAFQLSQARVDAESAQQTATNAAHLGLLLVLLTAGLCSVVVCTVWTRYDDERREGLDSHQRLQRLYVALSQTNQLIVRREAGAFDDADAELKLLLQELCRICVDTGHARFAAVVMAEGDEFERVAESGPGDRLMPGAPQGLAARCALRAQLDGLARDPQRHAPGQQPRAAGREADRARRAGDPAGRGGDGRLPAAPRRRGGRRAQPAGR